MPTHGIRSTDIKSADRHGTQQFVQISDGSGTSGNVPKFNADGSLTDSGIASINTSSGGDINGQFPIGSDYGQTPRGLVNGSNRVFSLDYAIGGPFPQLFVNGILQKPPRDGSRPYPGPDFTVSGKTLTYAQAPLSSDWHYIYYTIGQPINITVPTVGANAYLVSAHYPNPASAQWGGGAGFNDSLGLFTPHPTWIESGVAWDKRTDTKVLSTTELASLNDGSLYLLIEQFHEGTGVGPYLDVLDNPDPDLFWIYDAYITVVSPNGSIVTWRPTAWERNEDVGVLNPQYAIDGDPDTYAILQRDGYTSGWDGAVLRLDGWQVSNQATVDEVNGSTTAGSGTGATGNTASADQIAADMSGSNEGHPHGASALAFYNGPVNNGLPSGTGAIEFWGNLYVDSAGNPATNTRVAIRNVQLWWFNNATASWVNGVGPTNIFAGGYYPENYSGTQVSAIPFGAQLDGSRTYTTISGQVAHTFAPYPRVPINAANFGGLVVVAEAQLVLIDPAGTDDRSTAKFLFGVGSDGYPTTTGTVGTGNPTILAGKMKYVTSSWRSFAATTLSQSALEASLPPVDLTGVGS